MVVAPMRLMPGVGRRSRLLALGGSDAASTPLVVQAIRAMCRATATAGSMRAMMNRLRAISAISMPAPDSGAGMMT